MCHMGSCVVIAKTHHSHCDFTSIVQRSINSLENSANDPDSLAVMSDLLDTPITTNFLYQQRAYHLIV
ncbi:hypothetical protein EB796_020599 [Bugula neritina]|uniref:Uncharacterized protein n=1 Tax=Bugula neritina TaxID=10212 RepID=A0A7J7J4L7_BUGNE|nr:hypothetical protein EB796_020599 [Bugula neritina]